MLREKLHPKLQGEEFTLDDIEFPLLKVPGFELGEVDITTQLTQGIILKTPLISSPMDRVTGYKMAILMALSGGIGAIHFDFPTIGAQMEEVERVRRFEAGFVKNPVVLGKDATIADVFQNAKEHGFYSYPITEDGTLESPMVGLVKKTDVRYREDLAAKVAEVMTPKDRLIVAHRKDTLDINDIRAANAKLRSCNLETLPIIDDEYKVVALVTDRDLQMDAQYPMATKDDNKQLKVLVAVESRLETAKARIKAARDAGAAGIIVDNRNIFRSHIEISRWVKKEVPELDVILGNIVMPEVAKTVLDEAGDCIDAFRVGIGTGEVCITTELLGLGRAMGSSLYDIDQVVKEYRRQTGKFIGIIADGGIKSPAHIVGALMLGANCVMMGSELAGLAESPSKEEYDPARGYVKTIRGMGSAGAIAERPGANRYMVTEVAPQLRYAEGIEKKIPYKGPGEPYLNLLFAGVRQAMHGLGHRNLDELYRDGYIIPNVKATSKGTL